MTFMLSNVMQHVVLQDSQSLRLLSFRTANLFSLCPTGQPISSPLGSVNVLDNYQSILLERFNPRVGEDPLTIEGERCTIASRPALASYPGSSPMEKWEEPGYEAKPAFLLEDVARIFMMCVLPYTPDILPAYRWLLCYQWTQSQQKFQQEITSGKVGF